MTDPVNTPPPQIAPGQLAIGLPHLYVNLYEVSLVNNDEMVRLTFGAQTGPEGISRGPVVLMREDQARALAEGILACITQRHKNTLAQAMGGNPPIDTEAQ